MKGDNLMASEKVYGFCEDKCRKEVLPLADVSKVYQVKNVTINDTSITADTAVLKQVTVPAISGYTPIGIIGTYTTNIRVGVNRAMVSYDSSNSRHFIDTVYSNDGTVPVNTSFSVTFAVLYMKN